MPPPKFGVTGTAICKVQGAALHLITGKLWTNEHGARDGGEINLCLPSKNYGWPIITHGVDYLATKIGEGSAKAGLKQALHFWVPSIAVSGMAFDRALTQGNRTAVWVGGLAVQVLAKVTFEKNDTQGKWAPLPVTKKDFYVT
jgi:aldose sugar dehydrogenase